MQKHMLLALLMTFCSFESLKTINVHRASYASLPRITVHWENSSQKYSLTHSHLEAEAIFGTYDEQYFNAHLLPTGSITYRTTDQTVLGEALSKLLNALVSELLNTTKKKKTFDHFIVLKNQDFNPKTHSGLIILKFKHYPFVIKLFMETPETFVSPFSKGINPCFFFIMGGGMNRYLSGFTRVKNLEIVRDHIQSDPQWRNSLDTPRKWFWLPTNSRWFMVKSTNLGEQDHSMRFPGVYGIICDAIETDENFNIFRADNRKQAYNVCCFLGSRIDRHIDNFLIEKSSKKIILIDTEHFPTMVGLKEPLPTQGYLAWYLNLIKKCAIDSLLRSKQERKKIQKGTYRKTLRC